VEIVNYYPFTPNSPLACRRPG